MFKITVYRGVFWGKGVGPLIFASHESVASPAQGAHMKGMLIAFPNYFCGFAVPEKNPNDSLN